MAISTQQYRVAIGTFYFKYCRLHNNCSSRCFSFLFIPISDIFFQIYRFLGFCHANVRSLRAQSKLDDLKVMADEYFIDIITISETWLGPSDDNASVALPGFQEIIRNDRSGRSGGGVAVFCRENINFNSRFDLVVPKMPSDSSCIWIEVCLNGQKILVGTYY